MQYAGGGLSTQVGSASASGEDGLKLHTASGTSVSTRPRGSAGSKTETGVEAGAPMSGTEASSIHHGGCSIRDCSAPTTGVIPMPVVVTVT